VELLGALLVIAAIIWMVVKLIRSSSGWDSKTVYQQQLAARQAKIGHDPDFILAYALRRLVQALVDQNIALHEGELDELLAMAKDKSQWEQFIPITHIITAARRYAAAHPLVESHQSHLIALRQVLHPLREAWGQVIHDIDRLIAGAGGGTNFEAGDAFSDVALDELKKRSSLFRILGSYPRSVL